ncbi:hypothetical protein TCAL_14302 [Tigriopus californicus]|uniref:Uncharacterized protein n=1 Tax=Tigriopus californicus TaxID=6832 RepID=A0A553NFK0_TIGCA|nr:hypothetical protein TCAL_14302 [Tigriopus californicus]
MEDIRRKAMVKLSCAGIGPTAPAIKNIKGYGKSTKYSVYIAWRDSGKDGRKAHGSRSDKICTLIFLEGLKRSIKNIPETPNSPD